MFVARLPPSPSVSHGVRRHRVPARRRRQSARHQALCSDPSQGPADIVDRVADEVRHLRMRHGALPVSVIQDGAPELWGLVAQLRVRHGLVPTCELIDRFHVDERIAEVCELITYREPDACELRDSWRKYLDRSDNTIDRIGRRIDELLHHVLLGALDDDPRPAFWEHVRGPAFGRKSADHQAATSSAFAITGICFAPPPRSSRLPDRQWAYRGVCKSVVTMGVQALGPALVLVRTGTMPVAQSVASERAIAAVLAKLQVARFATLAAA
jgi:hypothetical protein